jgi:hypothetical protein
MKARATVVGTVLNLMVIFLSLLKETFHLLLKVGPLAYHPRLSGSRPFTINRPLI